MQFAIWAVVGAAICGLIGQKRDQLTAGLFVGAMLGPVFGPIVFLMSSSKGRSGDLRQIIPPEPLDQPRQQP